MDKQGYIKKLYFKQWVIGIASGDIREIIRTKNFPQDNIKWIQPGSSERFYADPFIIQRKNGGIDILYEDFSMEEHYGNISVMALDDSFVPVEKKILLDTGSHLSFPFTYIENGRYFIFPESVRSGCVNCYEYNPEKRTITSRGPVIRMPLYDPAILKADGRYWLFGSIFENRTEYKLYVFYSEKLTGPYLPLRGNPVRAGLNGIRAAGNFIHVDGDIFRPAQNCQDEYGESITINRLKVLDEYYFSEEPYMTINISKKNLQENNIHTIHTINSSGGFIVVDGMQWTFSPKEQLKNFIRNRRILKNVERIEP